MRVVELLLLSVRCTTVWENVGANNEGVWGLQYPASDTAFMLNKRVVGEAVS